ncbi:uncharacterized protein LOC141618841 [Silene latifolia]|uniref:uncharacterized protein LOC141618841 n=1 Tax=Silene latifolia TaxID=37657 RepID=UPI003D77AADF
MSDKEGGGEDSSLVDTNVSHENSDSKSTSVSHKDSDSESSDMAKGEKLSPYFLSTSDKSGDKLIVVELKGDNYDEWSVKLRGGLRSKKKMGFIDGTVKKPADDSDDIEDWYMVNAMIVNWIFNTIEPGLGSTISYVNEAKKLRDDIEQRFSLGNGPKVHRTKGSIMACKQGEKETITKYYMVVRRSFGMTLTSIRLASVVVEPLPSLNRAYATIIQEEGVKGKAKHIVGARTGENRAGPVSFTARFSPAMADGRSRENTDKEANSRPNCDNCYKYGHVRASCFDIIGYPKGWRDIGRGNGAGASRGGRGGHGGRGGYNSGQGRGNSAANSAGASRVGEEMSENKEQFRSVPKEQCDAYVNHAKASSSKVRMNGKTDNIVLWLLDLGATHHMTGCFVFLQDVKDIDACMVALPNRKFSKATKEGIVLLGGNLRLKDVLFVPDFNCNLVSIYQLSKDLDCEIKFTNNTCVIQDRISKKTIGTGEQKGRLYLLEGELRREVHAANKDSDNVETREKFIVSENKAKSIFELIHCDLWGDYRTPSSCGSRYFLTVIDDFSRDVWVYLIKTKDEVSQLLQNLIVMAKRQFDADVKMVRTDNGMEFTCLKRYFDTHGIIHQTTCVGTSQQNGRVERKHRHILNVARALLFQAGLPVEFWGKYALTAGYLINRTPSMLLQGKTPYELLFNKSPTYDNLHTFGCLCYAKHTRKDEDKFASCSR